MLTIAQLFDFSNLFVLPFWVLMIFLPNWQVTRRIMASLLPFVVLAGLYVYFIAGTINSETAQALANPKLADIARFFGDERAAATGWAHFLVMDLFVGRWIYWQGQTTGIWTVHSIALCLFAGPIGLLSHILTTWATQLLTKSESTPSDSAATEAPTPPSAT